MPHKVQRRELSEEVLPTAERALVLLCQLVSETTSPADFAHNHELKAFLTDPSSDPTTELELRGEMECAFQAAKDYGVDQVELFIGDTETLSGIIRLVMELNSGNVDTTYLKNHLASIFSKKLLDWLDVLTDPNFYYGQYPELSQTSQTFIGLCRQRKRYIRTQSRYPEVQAQLARTSDFAQSEDLLFGQMVRPDPYRIDDKEWATLIETINYALPDTQAKLGTDGNPFELLEIDSDTLEVVKDYIRSVFII